MVHGRNREEEAQQRKVGNRKQEAESRKQEIGKRERVLTKGRRDLHRLSTYFHFHFHFWGAFFFFTAFVGFHFGSPLSLKHQSDAFSVFLGWRHQKRVGRQLQPTWLFPSKRIRSRIVEFLNVLGGCVFPRVPGAC